MFIKVCPDTGFNSDAVAHWNFEMVAPPDPPVTQSARGRGAAARDDEDKERAGREAVPTPQEEVPVPQPVPTLTLYFIGGGELKLEGSDAEKVQNYYGVPSSYLTVL
jgi:hypothetical protein